MVPWIVKTNPNKIYNYNSNNVFSNLIDAISNSETKDGDTIGLGISKNNIATINLNKCLNFIPVPGIDVSLVNNSQSSKLIFNNGSSGSYLVDLNIKNVELNLNKASNICIYYSNISNNLKTAINLFNSFDNEIIGNNIYSSNIGVLLDGNSKDNRISNNIIQINKYGLKLNNCDENSIEGNIIQNNDFGVYAQNSSFDLEYNSISNNNQDLFDSGAKSSNLNNNWWGINNPKISASNSSEKIYSKKNSNLKYLILTLTSYNYYDNSTKNDYLRLLKASFKNNKDEDMDLEGFPLIPIRFETNKGSINQSNYMISGIGTAILTGSFNSTSSVKLTVSNQVINLPISFNKFANPVINSRNNKTFKTIQSAIDDVNTNDGDTLKLKAGVYLENVCIYKKLSLISFGDGESLLIPKNDSISSTIIVSCDGVCLKNLSIYGTASSNAVFSTGNAFGISNSKIFNSFAGIYLYDVINASLSNNQISGCSYALYLDGSDNGSFIGNKIFNNDYGILAKYSNINLFKNNSVFNNWIAIEDSSKYNQFLSNNIHDNYQGIRLIASNSALIENTNVYNNYLGILKYSSSFINKSASVYNNTLINVQSLNDGEIVIQDNMWYCGPAALSIIFESLGLSLSQEDIAKIAGTNTNGTSLYGLYQACIKKGFNPSVLKINSSDLKTNDLAVLLINEDYHFSVIYSINDTDIVLNDPSIGLFVLSRETFDEMFSGYVLDVEPIKDRVSNVSIAKMKTIVGTVFPALAYGGYLALAGVTVIAGSLAIVWNSNSHYNSKSIQKPHYTWKPNNKIHFPRNVKYPTSTGNNGNRPKVSYNPVTSSISGNKYYTNNKVYTYNYKSSNRKVSSSNAAIIAYQEAYNYYLSTKNNERAKVEKPTNITSYNYFLKDVKAFEKGSYKFSLGPKGPDDDLYDSAKIVKALYRDATRNYNYGKFLINTGNKSRGICYIFLATFEISFIPAIIYNQLSLNP